MLLKGQCNKIVDNFIWPNRFDVCLILTDKNGFANFFVFAKIFDRNFFYSYGGFHIFKLLLLDV